MEHSLLTSLRSMTKIVCDSSDFLEIEKYSSEEATTNPSLILKASEKEEYSSLFDEAISFAKDKGKTKKQFIDIALDRLFVNFGFEISKRVSGRISTEVDAKLSFDVDMSVARARRIISMYEQLGVSRDRILIKLATTWEGIAAAEQLENEGIHCNMTLLFSMPQAIACAQAGVTLISPFVGRILDWYKKNLPEHQFEAQADPGVVFVRDVYKYYKNFEYKTEVMGASFRNIDEIIGLAGCDLLTISPKLLSELDSIEGETKQILTDKQVESNLEKILYNESDFRFAFNNSQVGVEKLAEGIRLFAKDIDVIESRIAKHF